MTAKGYCTTDDIALFLGVIFSGAQAAQCDSLIESAELEFDGETNRGWLVGAQTLEAWHIGNNSPDVWLKYAPVASISAFKGRSALGETETDLVADTDYEVMDLTTGHIRLVYPLLYDRVRVTYTPVATVPADVKQAIVELVAARLMPTLAPGTYGLDSVTLPDYSVRYSRAHVQTAFPPTTQKAIDRWRWWVVG